MSDVVEAARRELRGGTTGVDLELGGVSIRAGAVPLFRRAADGGLLQCLRVVVRSDEPVRLAALDGEHVLDTADGAGAVRLFVPEELRSVMLSLGADRTAVELVPQRKWTIFVVHHSHLDIGYTDPQPLVLRHHLRYLDSVLDLAEATDGWPEPARFRWTVEANLPLERWLASRPRSLRDAMLERIREGRVEVCALPATLHTEACSIDELARQLAFADELRDRHDLPIVTAMQTDVPGTTSALADLLVAAGVRYLAVAHNYAGRVAGAPPPARPFWWSAHGGRRLLVWYTDSPHGVAYLEGNLLGLAESHDVALECLPDYLAALACRPSPYANGHPLLGSSQGEPYAHDVLHLRVQGEVADNAPPSLVPAEVVRAWNEEWAYPALRAATNLDFFTCVEERLGERLESHSGDWTDWWADGLGSGARALGFNRRAQSTLRTAQTLHVVADALGDETTAWRAESDRAYESMGLFDEHTWGSRVPWEDELEGGGSGAVQWERKAALAYDAHDRAEALLDSAASRLASVLRSSAQSVVVFNPSSFARSDVVRVFCPESGVPCGPRLVFEEERDPTHRPRGRYLRFVAHDVPALGFRRYSLDELEAGQSDEHYRFEVDPSRGCVVRLFDEELGLDLVDASSPFGFGGLVYDLYAAEPHVDRDLIARMPPAGPSLLARRTTARDGVVTERVSNTVEERITLRLVVDGAAWLETSYSLPRGIRRLDVVHRLAKLPTAAKESVYFTFPFALAEPRIAYEITGGVDSPTAPRVPGSAMHMRAVRHWVSLQDESATVAWATLEAPLVELGTIFLPYVPYPESAPRAPGTIVSWAMNNVWDTNFPSQQGGETVFRYAVASAPPDANARELGARTAAGLTQPLVGILCARGAERDAPERGSFCAVDRSDVEVVTMTGSRRGHDLAVFLHSRAEDEVEVRISFPDLPVERVLAGTFLERDLHELADFRLRIRPGEYLALAVDLRRT